MSAYEAVARHLAEEEDRETAVAFMKRAHEQNPDYLPLLKSYIEWEEFNGPEISVPLLEKAVALDPADLWSLRELARELSRARRSEEAIAKAREALAFDPNDASSHGILGLVYEADGRKPEAALAFRQALQIDIDHFSSFEGLMRVNNTFAERKDTLKFVREEMIRQVSDGDIVPEYRLQATGVVNPGELEKDLKTFRSERPDLWETWSALREHYHQLSKHEEELETARKMTENFPLLPRAWAELGFAARAMDLGDEEISAFKKALEHSPSWDWIMRELSVSLERLDRYDESLEVLERAIDVEPLAPGGYGYKADLLWKIGRREEAIAEIKRGLEVAPLYQWGWTQLIIWTKRVDRENEVPELIARLEGKRSHQWKWWMCLAEVYDDLEKPEEALAAVGKGLAQHPRGLGLLDLKATLLAQMGRYAEAFETCQTPFEDGKQPIRLQGREAWVMMQAGRRKEAWDRMKALSESEEDYQFTHSNLASWAYETDSWTELKNASERLILLSPDDSESWGYLGQAEEELENKEAALKAYTRALRASPSYLFGARRKANLEIEAGDLEEAERTLARIQHHHSNSFINADQLAIELRRCKRELTPAIREKWTEISMISAELDQDPYHYLDHLFEEAKLNSLYEILLSEQAEAGTFRSTAEARAWGRRIRVSKKRKRHVGSMLKSSLEDRFKASILAEVISGHSGDVPVAEIQKLISANSPLLEKHFDSWAAALAFFTHHSKTNEACLYGDLWRNFIDDLGPGSLAGYASFVDEARGLAAGTVVRQAILTEFPQWQGTKFLRVGLAFQKAIAGKIEEAEELITGYEDRHEPQAFYDSIYQHTLAIIAAHRGQALDCERHFRAAANGIREFPQDKAALLYLNASAQSCVTSLGIFKGKAKKLLHNWARGLGKEGSKINWWYVLLAVWIISRIIKAAS